MFDLVDVARTSVTGTNVTGTFLVRENWKEWARATARSPTPHGVPDPTREISPGMHTCVTPPCRSRVLVTNHMSGPLSILRLVQRFGISICTL